MKTMNKFAAVALTLCVAATANAGKGGGADQIKAAVSSGSTTRSSPRSNAPKA